MADQEDSDIHSPSFTNKTIPQDMQKNQMNITAKKTNGSGVSILDTSKASNSSLTCASCKCPCSLKIDNTTHSEGNPTKEAIVLSKAATTTSFQSIKSTSFPFVHPESNEGNPSLVDKTHRIETISDYPENTALNADVIINLSSLKENVLESTENDCK